MAPVLPAVLLVAVMEVVSLLLPSARVYSTPMGGAAQAAMKASICCSVALAGGVQALRSMASAEASPVECEVGA